MGPLIPISVTLMPSAKVGAEGRKPAESPDIVESANRC